MDMSHSKTKQSKDLPTTLGMLHEVRDDLRSEIRIATHSFERKLEDVKSEVHGLRSEFHDLKSEVHELKSFMEGFEVKMAQMDSRSHQMHLLMAEQHQMNKYVMDGHKIVEERQDRSEERILSLEKIIDKI